MKREKIFVSAYACEPGLGSEIGVGWHWVLEMSKYFELWVLTRESNRGTIEPWIAEHPEYDNIHWLYFDLPKWARFWKKGLRGVRTYYNLWQMLTNGIVRRTMQANGIKVFHHLTYGNVLWKVSSYGQRQCFIWGPVGGLETIPKEFSQHYGRRNRLIERVRRAAVAMLPLNSGLKKRCRNADLILCKTEITRDLLPASCRPKAVLQTDVAVVSMPEALATRRADDGVLRLITVGRLDAWRGFDLCIEALAGALEAQPGADIRLTIVGSGSDEERLRGIAEARGMAGKVTFAGKVPLETYKELLASSDVVINAALKEGAVTVAFDSMGMGKPLICLDTTGYTRYFNDSYAEVIKLGSRVETIKRLSIAILKMKDKELCLKMGLKAYEAGRKFIWEERGKEIVLLFDRKLKL